MSLSTAVVLLRNGCIRQRQLFCINSSITRIDSSTASLFSRRLISSTPAKSTKYYYNVRNYSLQFQQRQQPQSFSSTFLAPFAAAWSHYEPYLITSSSTSMTSLPITFCEAHAIANHPSRRPTIHVGEEQQQLALSRWQRNWDAWKRALRVIRRAIALTVTLGPCILLYPLVKYFCMNDGSKDENYKIDGKDARDVILAQNFFEDDTDASSSSTSKNKESSSSIEKKLLRWYLNWSLACVEHSGAAVIKLMQWAGSRPDLFGHEVCDVFSRLQDHTTPHSWQHTDRVLREEFGENFANHQIELFEILGSGCIGQVYRGRVRRRQQQRQQKEDIPIMSSLFQNDTKENNKLSSSSSEPNTKDGDDDEWQQVAVKVLHPNVEEDIDADLDLMRFLVRAARSTQALPFLDQLLFGSTLKWLNLEGIVEEFADLLKMQLDLRQEALNLERFNEHFKDDEIIVFPKLIPGYETKKNVLIETFCNGVPVLQFARENAQDREMLNKMCNSAIHAVCKMIFLDNFVHGDLHPGNVFVDPVHKKFILLDVGIVAEYAPAEHQLLVDILAAFIRCEGRKAGRLMIDDSNRRSQLQRDETTGANSSSSWMALEEEKYLDKIEELTIQAKGKDYLMEHLGTYISIICRAAAIHHVMMNPSFVTAALAVKVQEGIALALDPTIEIWRVAIPIIIQSETRRKLEQTKESFGFPSILEELLRSINFNLFGPTTTKAGPDSGTSKSESKNSKQD